MSSTISPIFKARGTIAALSRSRTPDDPELVAAKRSLAVLNLEKYVERVVSEAPPLTSEQADHIAALLRPTSGGAL